MSYDIVSHIQQHICKNKIRGHSPIHFYPSEASVRYTDPLTGIITNAGHCMRAAWYRCHSTPAMPEPKLLRTRGKLGDAVELMFLDMFKEMGIFEAYHTRFQNSEFNISGELDFILREPGTNVLFGCDSKSIYGYDAGKHVFGNKSTTPEPKIQHLLQVLVYTKEFRNTISYFKILYIERGTGEMKAYDVSIVPDELPDSTIIYRPQVDGNVIMDYTVDDIYNRYAQLQDHIVNNIVPPRDFELFYANDRIEIEREVGRISKSAYEAFKKVSKKDGSVKYDESKRPGDYQCSYCKFKATCYENSTNNS